MNSSLISRSKKLSNWLFRRLARARMSIFLSGLPVNAISNSTTAANLQPSIISSVGYHSWQDFSQSWRVLPMTTAINWKSSYHWQSRFESSFKLANTGFWQSLDFFGCTKPIAWLGLFTSLSCLVELGPHLEHFETVTNITLSSNVLCV